mgnify:CR=1 FL=1
MYNDDFDFEGVTDQNGFVSNSLISGTYNVSIGLWDAHIHTHTHTRTHTRTHTHTHTHTHAHTHTHTQSNFSCTRGDGGN